MRRPLRTTLAYLLLLLVVVPGCAPRPGAPAPAVPAPRYVPPPLPPAAPSPVAPPVAKSYLTELEQFCDVLATLARQFIAWRDAGVPLIRVREALRRTSFIYDGPPDNLRIALDLADKIYGEPWRWVEPGAVQRYEYICLHMEDTSPTP